MATKTFKLPLTESGVVRLFSDDGTPLETDPFTIVLTAPLGAKRAPLLTHSVSAIIWAGNGG